MIILKSSEKIEKANQEAVIKAGINSFMEVGRALSVIQHKRLYKDEYKTFDEYCRQKWKMTRQHVYNKIKAFEVVQNVKDPLQKQPNLPNLEQAHELAKLPPEQQKQAWDKAVAEAPVKDGMPQITGVQVKKSINENNVLARGEYTDRVAKALGSKVVFTKMQQQISKLIQEIKALSETPLGTFIPLQQLETDLRNAWQCLKFATPFAPCGYCGQDGCKVCHNQGWVTRVIHKHTPEGLNRGLAQSNMDSQRPGTEYMQQEQVDVM